MPRPTAGLTIRPELGEVATQYFEDFSGFIARKIFPVYPAPYESGQYYVIPFKSQLKIQNTRRAPRTEYQRGDFSFDEATYSCAENGFEYPLDDREAKQYKHVLDCELVATRRATDIIMRKEEKEAADLLMNPDNAGSTYEVGSAKRWSDPETCDPLKDIKAAKKLMRQKTGLAPNTLVLGPDLYEMLTECNKITTVTAEKITPVALEPKEAKLRLLATYFDISEIIIGNELQDSADENTPADLKNIWGDRYAALIRKPRFLNDLQDPCFGRTFVWKEDGSSKVIVESYREENKRSTIIRARNNLKANIVYKGGLVLIDALGVG